MNNINANADQVQLLLQKATNIVSENDKLEIHQKEKLQGILKEVDFLMGRHDKYYDRFLKIFESMSVFDFTRELTYSEDDDEFVKLICYGINTIICELNDKVIHKNIVHRTLDALTPQDTLILMTNSEGVVNFINAGSNSLPGFTEQAFLGLSIYVIFQDFSDIDKRIRVEGSLKNMATSVFWQGESVPCLLTVSISLDHGKVHGVVYVIKILDK